MHKLCYMAIGVVWLMALPPAQAQTQQRIVQGANFQYGFPPGYPNQGGGRYQIPVNDNDPYRGGTRIDTSQTTALNQEDVIGSGAGSYVTMPNWRETDPAAHGYVGVKEAAAAALTCPPGCSGDVCGYLNEVRRQRLEAKLKRARYSMTSDMYLMEKSMDCVRQLLDVDLLHAIFNLPSPLAILAGLAEGILSEACGAALTARRQMIDKVTRPLEFTVQTPRIRVNEIGTIAEPYTVFGTSRFGSGGVTVNTPGSTTGHRTTSRRFTPAELRDRVFGAPEQGE